MSESAKEEAQEHYDAAVRLLAAAALVFEEARKSLARSVREATR